MILESAHPTINVGTIVCTIDADYPTEMEELPNNLFEVVRIDGQSAVLRHITHDVQRTVPLMHCSLFVQPRFRSGATATCTSGSPESILRNIIGLHTPKPEPLRLTVVTSRPDIVAEGQQMRFMLILKYNNTVVPGSYPESWFR